MPGVCRLKRTTQVLILQEVIYVYICESLQGETVQRCAF